MTGQAGRRLLLVGGGHSHVAVLADWIRKGPPPGASAMLLTPHPTLCYSGMVPGWLAGEYERGRGTVDLVGLARAAGIELLIGRCTAIDPERGRVKTGAGREIGFDIASLDTGGIGRAAVILGEDPRLVDIRPIDAFVERIAAWRHRHEGAAVRIAVVGGGAGGVEIAFGMRNGPGFLQRPEIVLVTGRDGLLPGFSDAVRKRARSDLARQGVNVVEEDARFEGGALLAGEGSLEPLDLVIAAVGSGAPEWPKKGGLATDEHGFVAVDRYQRSVSHPNVFAVGDVAARQDRTVPHSGVHAVFAGPKLAVNLRRALAGEAPGKAYRPRWNSLYLMTTGNGRAIASYGPLGARGRWVAWLKRWIDGRWIDSYAKLAKGA